MDISMIIPFIKGMCTAVLPGVARSFYGWAHQATKDMKVTKFELEQLLQTVTRTSLYGVLGYVGFNLSGVDNAELAAIVSAIITDKVVEAIKKR